MKRKIFISYLLISSILIYSLSFTILFYSVLASLYQTIESIKIPDSYFIINPSSESPDVKISFSISNNGYFELNRFRINLSLDLRYYEEYSNKIKNATFFKKVENYGPISPRKTYYDVIQGNQEDFNISVLENFEAFVNTSKEINYLIYKFRGWFIFLASQFIPKLIKEINS